MRSGNPVQGLFLVLILAQGCGTRAAHTQTDSGSPDGAAVNQPDAGSCPNAVATGSAPLIDDFTEDTGRIAPLDGRSGSWFFYDDGTSGKQVHTVTSADGNPALHVTSTGYALWGSGVITPLSASSSVQCSYDAKAYGGLHFRARGSGRIRLKIGTPETTQVSLGGTCTSPGDDCFDRPGIFIDLQPNWQEYAVPFCRLRQEGWSSLKVELVPGRLMSIAFDLSSQSDVDFWLDDLSFTKREPANEPGGALCLPPCPLQAAPATARFAPDETYLPLTGGLELHTFAQETVRCGPLTRRYLSFVPPGLPQSSSVPVLFALHGLGANAESVVDLQTHHRLDDLARRDGVVVIYGNGAPGEWSSNDAQNVNSAAWRAADSDDGEVDDVEYLGLVLADLKQRGVISGDNPVYLAGLSNGGGMVLTAARKLAARLSGIAAFMPYDGFLPPAIPDLTSTQLTRVLFGISTNDPGLPRDYLPILDTLPTKWAMAMGIPSAVISGAVASPLPDLVMEGKDYTGTNEIALRTRNSHASQIDYRHPTTNAQVRALIFEKAGHFWPTPTADTEDWILNQWGFRNQDVDASDALWEFFGFSHAVNQSR